MRRGRPPRAPHWPDVCRPPLTGWPPEPLSARERRLLSVSPIRSHLRSPLHARYSTLSDVGTTRPGVAESRATRWADPEQELLLVEYEVVGTRPYYELTNPCHDAGTC